MTVNDLIEKLKTVPGDLELWKDVGSLASPESLGVVAAPIYFKHWPDEESAWDFREATKPGDWTKVKRVAILVNE
jgi:hypothetical protein